MTPDHKTDDGSQNGVKLIGHRGFKGVAPENTLGAFRLAAHGGQNNHAAERQADMIELDVVPCGGRPHEGDDFRVVVFHDWRLANRDGGERGLTDAPNKLVWEADCDTVTSAEVLDSGETVPTLDQALEAIPSDIGVNIELKNPGDTEIVYGNISDSLLEQRTDIWQPFVERVLDIASNHENEILVSSFMEGAIAATRTIDPSVPVGFLLWYSITEGLEVAEEYDVEAVHPPLNMLKGTGYFNDNFYSNVPEDGFASVELVETAHNAGRAVNVWTIDSWYQAEQAIDAGVDGIIGNYPNLLRFGAVNNLSS